MQPSYMVPPVYQDYLYEEIRGGWSPWDWTELDDALQTFLAVLAFE